MKVRQPRRVERGWKDWERDMPDGKIEQFQVMAGD
jgi:hypothetical protein